ncbi:MAG: SPOR domain-containing protein [Coriobacteriia bacterium]|nr:SPOR domain-containing protein [Coriobacteriia bacterium]
MNHSNQNTGGGANTATVDTPSSQTEEPASGQGDTAGVAPQEETNANNGSSSGQDSTTQGGSSSSTDELHSGKPADDYAPAGGFWGIWTAASKNEDVLAKPFGKLASAGYPTCVITTSKWSNLNPETWYAVCSGPYSSEAEAKSKLAEVRSVSGDDSAYVKWSGTRK